MAWNPTERMGSRLFLYPPMKMIDGGKDNTELLPNNLKGFTIEINALDAEMSQMVTMASQYFCDIASLM